jgi:hypothetical protein
VSLAPHIKLWQHSARVKTSFFFLKVRPLHVNSTAGPPKDFSPFCNLQQKKMDPIDPKHFVLTRMDAFHSKTFCAQQQF